MGVNDRINDKKDDRRVKNDERRMRRQTANHLKGAADWAGVDGSLIAKAVAAMAANGGALRFGYTRDGGAYSVGFYGDGEPFTEYVSPGDDVEEFLRGVIEDYGK